MAKNRGYILTFRDEMTTDIYNMEPFDRWHALEDLRMRANHEEREFVLGHEVVRAEKGSVVTSERRLAEAWKWNKKKVRSFLILLENSGIIERITDTKKTVLIIKDYDELQGTAKRTTQGTTEGTALNALNIRSSENVGTTQGTTEGTAEGLQRRHYNQYTIKQYTKKTIEDDNVVRLAYGKYNNVYLSGEEFNDIKQYTHIYETKIDKRSTYKYQHPDKNYVSDYKVIKKWCEEDSMKGVKDNDAIQPRKDYGQTDELNKFV